MQIKMVRYDNMPMGIAKIKNTDNTKCGQDVKLLKYSQIVGQNVNQHNCVGKQFSIFL